MSDVRQVAMIKRYFVLHVNIDHTMKTDGGIDRQVLKLGLDRFISLMDPFFLCA
jgi:hypothetical protein